MLYLLLSVALVLSGCASSGNPQLREEAVVSQIKIGESTKEDVRRLLGEPNVMSKTVINGRSMEAWAYGYSATQTNPLLFVPVVGLFTLGSNPVKVESAGFGVTFSDDGIVRSITRHRSSTGGNQPSVETQTETTSPLP